MMALIVPSETQSEHRKHVRVVASPEALPMVVGHKNEISSSHCHHLSTFLSTSFVCAHLVSCIVDTPKIRRT